METMTEEQNLDTIGKRIRACMKQHGISMRALSRKLSISQPSVFKWTHDELTPKIEQVVAMAAFFEVRPEWLAFGCTEPQGKASKGTHAGLKGDIYGMSFGISDEVAKAIYGVASEDLFLMQINSDEMSPSLKVGDIAIVNRTVTSANTSGIYVLVVGKDYVLRRVQRLLGGRLRITCDNKNYPEIETVDNVAELTVVGKVVSRLTLSFIH